MPPTERLTVESVGVIVRVGVALPFTALAGVKTLIW